MDRRSFLKKSAAASSFFIIPRFVLGGNGYTAPSDRLSIASIGCGGKGRSDIINASVNGRENVVALCDIDPNGNHGVIDVRKKFPKAKFNPGDALSTPSIICNVLTGEVLLNPLVLITLKPKLAEVKSTPFIWLKPS